MPTNPVEETRNQGAGCTVTVGEALCEAYLHIKTNPLSKDNLTKKVDALRKELCDSIRALREIDSMVLPNIDAQWWFKGLKHEYPEVKSLTQVNDNDTTSTQGIFRLCTHNAPMEFVFKGEDCFYITSNMFYYEIKFKPGYAWIVNNTPRLQAGNAGDLTFTAGTHPHSQDSNDAGGFSNICTGPQNPFFKKLKQDSMRSDNEIKSMLKLGVRWLRTYNVNDAYHSIPIHTANQGSTFKAKIEATLKETGQTHVEFVKELATFTDQLYRLLSPQPTSTSTSTQPQLNLNLNALLLHHFQANLRSTPKGF